MSSFTKHREPYTAREFIDRLKTSHEIFLDNMDKIDHLKNAEMSFAEWYELYGSWLEVDTYHEKYDSGPRFADGIYVWFPALHPTQYSDADPTND